MLIRRAALARGERAWTAGNVSALLEGLIRQHWAELETEAKNSPNKLEGENERC